MNIFVDEAGSFVPAKVPDSWSTIVAYVSPEIDRARLNSLINPLRREFGDGGEAKINDIPETRFAKFLGDLADLRGVAFCVASEAHASTEETIRHHQRKQAEKVVEHVDKMIHETARRGLRNLADEIRALSPQLYTQLICQVELFHDALSNSVSFYATRIPATLAKIRWRIDRKDVVQTAYEKAFRMVLPALLQTKSLREPMIMIKDAGDYRHFKRYEFPVGAAPTYLFEHYGIATSDDVADVGKMVRDDLKLLDSNSVVGIQIADLLASGLRRTLRGRFTDLGAIARLLGANMVGLSRGEPSLRLIAVGEGPSRPVTQQTKELFALMKRATKPYLPRGF
jgi:hypothetical protein